MDKVPKQPTQFVVTAVQRLPGWEELAASLRLGLAPQVREAEGRISQQGHYVLGLYVQC